MLDDLIRCVAQHPCTAVFNTSSSSSSFAPDKIVVVSNFTSALDQVVALGKLRRWRYLRIDGKVVAERRMTMIRHFNSAASGFDLMLLSAKAGGVGINLVGGNRLVMLDPDWNPATDQQAMGRVWREGQTKPVFIYRFVSTGTVEETILSRQCSKVSHLLFMQFYHMRVCVDVLDSFFFIQSSLSAVIREDGQDVDEAACANEEDDEQSNSKLFNGLTVAGLQSLVLPVAATNTCQLRNSEHLESDRALSICYNNCKDKIDCIV